MRGVSGLRLWLVAIALAGGSLPCAGEARAADSGSVALTAVARSALVSLEADAAPAGVTLRVRRAADRTPLPATELSVSIAGRTAPATSRGDGSWFVPLAATVGAGDGLEVVVAHDGIREVLSARFVAPGTTAAGAGASGSSSLGTVNSRGAASLWRDHKQMAWWILNITVVLIAAIAISRRLS
jgi:hypothetical protein